VTSNWTAGIRRTFRALATPNYRLFFTGQIVSVTGSWMQRVAQDWLIIEVGGGPLQLSIGVALQSVPALFLSMWGGLLIDRVRHVRLLFLATQIAMALIALVLGTLIVTGHVTLLAIYVAALATGLVGVVDTPARHTFVLEMVDPADAANAVSLNSSINNSARLVGPAVAGVLIGTAGTGVAYFVNASTFLAIIAALLLMRRDSLTPRMPEKRGRGQVLAGFRYAWATPQIRTALAATLLVSAFAQNFRVTLPTLAATEFHGGPDAYGWLMSCLGIGALAGALICAYLANPSLPMIAVELIGLGVLIVGASLAPGYAIALVLMIGTGAGNTSFNTTSNALILITAEPQMRGRVLSIRSLMSNGSTPIGSLAVGWVCDSAGARAGLAVGGGVALLASLLTYAGNRQLSARPAPGSASARC
jgi:MFS family permease